jgi:hypothetical protein
VTGTGVLTPPFFSRFLVRRDVMKGLQTVTVVAIFLLGSGVGASLAVRELYQGKGPKNEESTGGN